MARVVEAFGARESRDEEVKKDQSEETRQYFVTEAADEEDAKTSVKAFAPSFIVTGQGKLTRTSVAVTDSPSASVYYIDAIYSKPEKEDKDLDTGEYRVSFDTTGRTFNRKTSIATQARGRGDGEKPIDFQRAINVATDGSVAGVDVVTPGLKFQVIKKQPNALLTTDYMLLLEEMTGRINDSDFLDFEQNELLFLGATGAQQVEFGEDIELGVEVTYHFEAQQNRTDIPIGEGMAIPFKFGWDYAWVYFEKKDVFDEDDELVATLHVPAQWNVEIVYEQEDFDLLEI